MNIYDFFNTIFADFIEGAIVLLIFVAFNCKTFIKTRFVTSVFFVFFYTGYLYLLNSLFRGYSTLLVFVFLTLLLSYMTRTNLYATLITNILIFAFLAVTELLTIAVIALVFNVSVFQVITDQKPRFIATIACKFIIQTLPAILLYFSKIDFSRFHILRKQNSIYFYKVMEAIIYIANIVTLVFMMEKDNRSIFDEVTVMVMSALFIAFIFFDIKEREHMAIVQSQFQIQQVHVKNMETVIDVIRKEKHEFTNHLNTLIAMCLMKTADSQDKVVEYARKLLDNTGSSYRFYNTGNRYVDGLLAVKSNYANEHGIILDIDLEAPLTDVEIDDVDLTSILGNIIDNAFDTLILFPRGEKGTVSVYTYEKNDKYCISISNDGIPIPEKDLDKVFDNKFTTKKQITNTERGFGLYITKQLVLKNSGKISVYSFEESTEFLIEFNVKKVKKAHPVNEAQIMANS